jgi:glycosyltransferase involved in cell wall biosynthesis
MKADEVHKPGVLFIGPVAPPTGGMTVSLDNLVTSGLKERYDLSLLDITGYMARTGRVNIFLIAYHQFYHLFELVRILITKKISIVHVQMTTGFYFYRRGLDIIICKLFGKKVVFHLRGGRFINFYEKGSIPGRWIKKQILGICDAIIVLADYWKIFLSSIVDPKTIEVVPNGVKLSEFRMTNNMKDALGIPRGTTTVLFMGPVGQRKGAFDMVDVVSLVTGKIKDIVFVFCGAEERKDELDRFNRLLSSKDISPHIRYAGDVAGQEKYDYYLSADIFVLPSYVENFPNSLLEAMAAGLPVVVSGVGVIPEMIQDGMNGFIIAPGDVASIAEKIILLSNDKELRQSMGERNLKMVKEKYDMPLIADKIDRIYKQCLGYAA